MSGWLYTWIYTILDRGPGHLWILVSGWAPWTNSPEILRLNYLWGESEVILGFSTVWGGTTNSSTIQGSTAVAKKILAYEIQMCKSLYMYMNHNTVVKNNMVDWFNYMRRFSFILDVSLSLFFLTSRGFLLFNCFFV